MFDAIRVGLVWILVGCLPFVGTVGALPADLYERANQQYLAGQYLEALTSIRKALGQKGSRAADHHLCSRILAELHQFSEAEQQVGRAIELAPDQAQMHADHAVLLLRQDKKLESLAPLKRALELDAKNLQLRLLLGATYHSVNLIEQALEQLRMVVQRDPAFRSVHYRLADVYLDLGKDQAAIRELELELANFPDDSQTRIRLAENLLRTGKPQRALDRLLAERSNTDRIHYLLAKIYRELGNATEAIRAARKSIELNPESLEGHYLLGQLYVENGQPERARQQLETYTRLGAEQP